MTSPIDAIREEYRLHPREESFQVYLDWHIENGFVFSTPQFFIMGRAIKVYDEDAKTKHGIDNFAVWEREEENCWFVHSMAGDLSKAWDILPYPLPFLSSGLSGNGLTEWN